MTILSAQSIKEFIKIEPFVDVQKQALGLSYGLGPCGYDMRIGTIKKGVTGQSVQRYVLKPGEFLLVSVLDRVTMPENVCAEIKDKSTWARRGLAVQNTIVEPGWEGYLTLELSNHGQEKLLLMVGQPIAQIVFNWLDKPTDRPYPKDGKYQDQPPEPIGAIPSLGHHTPK
jgi:dCTP deaminase